MEIAELIVEMLHTGHIEALQDVLSRLYGQREGYKEEALRLKSERGSREAEIGALKMLVEQQTRQLMENPFQGTNDVVEQMMNEYHACNATLNDIARSVEPHLPGQWDGQKLTDKCAWFVRYGAQQKNWAEELREKNGELEERINGVEGEFEKALIRIAEMNVQLEERQKAIESMEKQISAGQKANLLLAKMAGGVTDDEG